MSYEFNKKRNYFNCFRSVYSHKYVNLISTVALLGGLINDVFIPSIQNLIAIQFRFLGTFTAFGIILILVFHSIFVCYRNKSDLPLFLIHLSKLQFSLGELKEIMETEFLRDEIILNMSKFQNTNQPSDWIGGRKYQDQFFTDFLQPILHNYKEIHYIGIAPIPFVIHLGYLLGNKLKIRYYERQRSITTINPWLWTREELDPKWELKVTGKSLITKDKDILLTTEQSYSINRKELPIISENIEKIQVKVPSPSIYDLHSEKQLHIFAKTFSEIFDQLNVCKSIHLLTVSPVSTAFVIGQNVKKSVNPEVVVYRYKKTSQHRYKEVFRLNESY